MGSLFCKSIARYLGWWVQSLLPDRHPDAPLGWKRFGVIVLGLPAFILFQLVHWLGFLLDELMFSAYRKVVIREPVFITGIPRSGTTFVHRTLASDDAQFTTVNTWEALLAPSICERKAYRLLAAIDKTLGRPVRKLLDWATRSVSGDFKNIHEVALTSPEEDYLWLLPTGSCFILLLAFPFSPWLRQMGMFNKIEAGERAQLLDFYQLCIQKHLYCSGYNRRFLSKNAAFASWSGDLLRRFPDATLLCCVREPNSALSSQLSSLHAARSAFATDPSGKATAERFMEIFAHNYAYLANFVQVHADTRLAVLDQGDLKDDPGVLLGAALDRVGISPGSGLASELAHHHRRHQSAHRPNACEAMPTNDEIKVCLRPAYELILQSSARVSPVAYPDESQAPKPRP